MSERGRKIRPYISTETYKKKMMPEIEEDLVKPEIRRKFAGNRAQLQLTVATTMEHQKFP